MLRWKQQQMTISPSHETRTKIPQIDHRLDACVPTSGRLHFPSFPPTQRCIRSIPPFPAIESSPEMTGIDARSPSRGPRSRRWGFAQRDHFPSSHSLQWENGQLASVYHECYIDCNLIRDQIFTIRGSRMMPISVFCMDEQFAMGEPWIASQDAHDR
jgi:hypothetical protein